MASARRSTDTTGYPYVTRSRHTAWARDHRRIFGCQHDTHDQTVAIPRQARGRPALVAHGALTVNACLVRGRIWRPSDDTGGAIDDVFAALRRQIPNLLIERLRVMHAGDDDNVYFLGTVDLPDLVQIDTAPNGQPPFTVEAAERLDTDDPLRAAAAARAWIVAGQAPSRVS